MTRGKFNPSDDRPYDNQALLEEGSCFTGSRERSRSMTESSHNANGTNIALVWVCPARCVEIGRSEPVRSGLHSTIHASSAFRNMMLDSVRRKSDFKLDKLDPSIIQDITHENIRNSANVTRLHPVKKRQRFTDGSSHFNVNTSRPVDSVYQTDAEPHISSSSENQARDIDQSLFEKMLQRSLKKAIEEVLREQSCSMSEMLNGRIPSDETKSFHTEEQYESQNSQTRKRWDRLHQTAYPPSWKPKPNYRPRKPECDKFHPIPLQFDLLKEEPVDYRRYMRYLKGKQAFEIGKTTADRMLDRRLAALYRKLLPKRSDSKDSAKQNIPHWLDKFGRQFRTLKKTLPHYTNATLNTIRRRKATLDYRRGLKHGRRSPTYLMMANTRKQIPSILVWEAQEKLKLLKQNSKERTESSCRLEQDLIYDPVSSRPRQHSPYSACSPLQCVSSMADKIGSFSERKTLQEILKKIALPEERWRTKTTSKSHSYNSDNSRFADNLSETQCSPVKREIYSDIGTSKSQHADDHPNNCLSSHQDRKIPNNSTHESVTSLGKPSGSSHQVFTVCNSPEDQHIGLARVCKSELWPQPMV